MNVASLGNSIYHAIKDDAVACAAIRTEFSALALQIATDPNASARVTSATINGQTFSAQSTISNMDRLKVLRWIVACIDAGQPISTTQTTTF